MRVSPVEVMLAFNRTFPSDIRKIDPKALRVEPYYWDSFWIIKGLLVSGMIDTAKGMARNLASLVDRYGFVYYTKRSQPPLLIPSVYVIYEQTDDLDFVKELMPSLEREFQFWQTERKHPIQLPNNETREVFFYRPYTFTPRPESMRVDLNHSDGMDERTRSRLLPYFAEVQGDLKKSRMYEQMHTEFRYVLNEVFYNNDYGSWFDYNSRTREHIVHTYPSVATPLFTGCYDQLDTDKPRRLFHAFLAHRLLQLLRRRPHFPWSRTPTSNGCWAPLNHMIIEGGGGEYGVVTGFGWSNGVILDLLSTYYDRIRAPPRWTRTIRTRTHCERTDVS
ncbi:Trehalase [Aphelenchoides fujianensis]|nr:Trehalase [Aphelenchoides fujianensis]